MDIRGAGAVALGGALGALGRHGVDLVTQALGLASPWATLVVNVAGCLAMGLLVAAILADPGRHPLWRPLVGIGLLGGFTTFSAFAGDAVTLVDDGQGVAAAAYIVARLVGGLAAVRLGVALGEHRRAARGAS
ncbi:MAG: fluoride efflux transporter FluC [Candidatus Nanopelagicales bacterium]